MPELTKPIIHLNGTSAKDLLEGYTAAYRAVNAAWDAVRACNPNGRDYYCSPTPTLSQAIHEQNLRLNALTKIAEELMDLASHCADHVKETRINSSPW